MAKFCPQCGAPLSPAQVDEPPAPVPPTQVAAPGVQAPAQQQPTAPPPYQQPSYQPPPQAPEKPRRNRTCLILGAIGLALALLVCCVAVVAWAYTQYVAEADITPTIPMAQAPELELNTPEPPPTQSAPQPAAPEEPPLPAVDYANVHFQYHPELAIEVAPETVPAYTDPNAPPWELEPEHLVFNFLGYPLPPDAFHEPRIYVYPTDEYTAINPAAGQVFADLRAFLDRRPTELGPDETIPALPIWNASQIMQSNIAYLEFQNGRGVRFLTQYGQAISPIDNRNLFYSFQGLTNDGRYCVAAVLPLGNPILDGAGSIVVDDNFANNFSQYIQSTERDLSAQPPESFAPSLAMLDETLNSLRVE